MRFRTHLMSGFLCYFIIYNFFNIENIIIALGLCLLFSIIADIDLHSSYIGKQIPGFSFIFEIVLGHRGITHSLWPVLAIIPFLYASGYAITLSAYIAHLFLDTITRKGIAWIWPFVRIKGPFETGGIMDSFLFYIMLLFNAFSSFQIYA